MKRHFTILALLAAALLVAGCMDSGGDDLEVKEIPTDTSAEKPIERAGSGPAEVGTAEMTPGISEEEAQARLGTALDNK
jgi:hypothetical protein